MNVRGAKSGGVPVFNILVICRPETGWNENFVLVAFKKTIMRGFMDSHYITRFISHQMQNAVFRSIWYFLTVDVVGGTRFTQKFSLLEFLKCVHLLSPVTIRCRNALLVYLVGSIVQNVFRYSYYLSPAPCTAHFSSLWTSFFAFKREEIISFVTPTWYTTICFVRGSS